MASFMLVLTCLVAHDCVGLRCIYHLSRFQSYKLNTVLLVLEYYDSKLYSLKLPWYRIITSQLNAVYLITSTQTPLTSAPHILTMPPKYNEVVSHPSHSITFMKNEEAYFHNNEASCKMHNPTSRLIPMSQFQISC